MLPIPMRRRKIKKRTAATSSSDQKVAGQSSVFIKRPQKMRRLRSSSIKIKKEEGKIIINESCH